MTSAIARRASRESSTTSTGSCGSTRTGASTSVSMAAVTGISTITDVPCPTREFTRIVPSIRSIRLRTTARPRPLPSAIPAVSGER